MEKIKIGQEVYIIGINLEILKKKVISIIKGAKETTYKLDMSMCNGITECEIFLTEAKAEVGKQNYLDSLKYKIGDLVGFNPYSFDKKDRVIGRIDSIGCTSTPYMITTMRNIYHVKEKDIILKIKNEYIENFKNLQELDKEFNEAKNKVNIIISKICTEHEFLEKDLNLSMDRQFSWYNRLIRKKPLFQDRFECDEDNGPRTRSPTPSKPKGGNKKGGC